MLSGQPVSNRGFKIAGGSILHFVSVAVHIGIGLQTLSGYLADLFLLAERQRAGALQDASRIFANIVSGAASWTSAALRRFSRSLLNGAPVTWNSVNFQATFPTETH